MDLSQITKLLALTQSDNDHEALLAARKANAILKSNNTMWHELIEQSPQIQEEAEITIKEMLHYLLSRENAEKAYNFFKGLNKNYVKKGHLSERQLLALMKCYASAQRWDIKAHQ